MKKFCLYQSATTKVLESRLMSRNVTQLPAISWSVCFSGPGLVSSAVNLLSVGVLRSANRQRRQCSLRMLFNGSSSASRRQNLIISTAFCVSGRPATVYRIHLNIGNARTHHIRARSNVGRSRDVPVGQSS